MRKPSAVEWHQKLTGEGPIHSPVPCYTSSPKRKTEQNKAPKTTKKQKHKNTQTQNTQTKQNNQTNHKPHSDVTGAS